MKTTKSILNRIFWGLFFLLAAVLIGLQTFGVISLELNIGSLLLLVLITAAMICSAVKLFWIGVFLPAALGVVLLSQANVLPAMTGEQTGMTFAIAALIALAFHILFRCRKSHICADSETNFGSSVKYFNQKPLESASLECNFGSIKAYFTETKLKNKTATINIECNFGGIELFVPKNWHIEQKLSNSFAATNEKNRPALTESSPIVTLAGECNFGAITIIYT